MSTISLSPAQTTPTPPPIHQGHPSDTSTEALLTTYSKTFIHLLNTRQYNDPFFFAHVRQNVYTDLAGRCTIGLAPFLDNHRADAQTSTNFFVDADWNVTACVDELAGSGTVIMSQHLSGLGGSMEGMARAGTILFAWHRSRGRWWCGDCCMIYGTPEFLV